ncbi:MAG: 5-formyltetrahydrofolate cyclo-ligase [Gammaproteobacteria bacterium]
MANGTHVACRRSTRAACRARSRTRGPARAHCALRAGRARAPPAGTGRRLHRTLLPFRGELDLRPLADSLADRAVDFALPVVAAPARPLVFRRWWPGMRMTRGVWGIPVPAAAPEVTPDVLLVPLLGYDDAGYRLGHGGGYYDRTLAAAVPRPLAIGVGYAGARLPTILPQPHDMPMDVIVTDTALTRYRGRGAQRAADLERSWGTVSAGASVSHAPAATGGVPREPAGHAHDAGPRGNA